MRRFRVIVTIGVLLALSTPAHAQDLVLSRLPSYFEALRSQAGIPALAATIIGPDDVIWEQSFGFQDRDPGIDPQQVTGPERQNNEEEQDSLQPRRDVPDQPVADCGIRNNRALPRHPVYPIPR